jgi:hypothetical protein
MISFTADKLRILNYPWYTEAFISSVRETLGGRISRIFGNETEILRLLDALLFKQ